MYKLGDGGLSEERKKEVKEIINKVVLMNPKEYEKRKSLPGSMSVIEHLHRLPRTTEHDLWDAFREEAIAEKKKKLEMAVWNRYNEIKDNNPGPIWSLWRKWIVDVNGVKSRMVHIAAIREAHIDGKAKDVILDSMLVDELETPRFFKYCQDNCPLRS